MAHMTDTDALDVMRPLPEAENHCLLMDLSADWQE